MRGRPPSSPIRQRIVNILARTKPLHGYGLHKIYCAVYPACTIEALYYNLKKGVDYEQIKIEKSTIEEGHFSWGPTSRKTYYTLGKNAKPEILTQEEEEDFKKQYTE